MHKVLKEIWRQLETDQLDFRLGCDWSHDTRDLGFYTGLIGKTDKYIKVAYGHFVTAKQTGEVQIKVRNANGKSFIAALYNVLLAPDFSNQLFYIIEGVHPKMPPSISFSGHSEKNPNF